ncbi:hypothetical protein GF402_04095 [Candidatus Fermentibacteria bacterium]|nr:hypothetical protein [Candidatus Fermentibacteria bacterium]
MSRDLVLAATAAVAVVACLSWISGPSQIDAVDGAEFSIGGSDLEVVHPPGYPLFLAILKSSGCQGYRDLRAINSLLAGLAAGAMVMALSSLDLDPHTSLAASILYMTLTPVMSQLNVLEIHGLSILLVCIAVWMRRTPSGPYALSLSIFGGHPVSVFAAPLVLRSSESRRWLPLAALPLSLLLYVPLRAGGNLMLHYGKPGNINSLTAYMSMYSKNVQTPSIQPLFKVLSELGPIALAVLACFAVLSRRFPRLSSIMVVLLSAAFLSLYDIVDIGSLSWLLLFPVVLWVAEGMTRLTSRGGVARMLCWGLVAAASVAGTAGAWRAGDRTARTIACDLMRSAGPNGVYFTVGHNTYYAAHLFRFEDRRPDLLPADLYGNYFSFRPLPVNPEVIPPVIGGRPVYATRAWGRLPLWGLLFTAERPGRPDWSMYDTFREELDPFCEFGRDAIAECIARRAVQMEDEQRKNDFWEEAFAMAATDVTRNRLVRLRELSD